MHKIQLDMSLGVEQCYDFLAPKTAHQVIETGLRHGAQVMSLGPGFSPFLSTIRSRVGFIQPQALQRPPASATSIRLSPQGVKLSVVPLAPPSQRLKYQWEKGTYLSATNCRKVLATSCAYP